MASKLGEILAGAFLPVIGSVGQAHLVDILAQVKEKNEEGYKSILQGVYPPLKRILVPVVKGTKTKFDDTLVDAIVGAIEESAEANGVALPDVSDAPATDATA